MLVSISSGMKSSGPRPSFHCFGFAKAGDDAAATAVVEPSSESNCWNEFCGCCYCFCLAYNNLPKAWNVNSFASFLFAPLLVLLWLLLLDFRALVTELEHENCIANIACLRLPPLLKYVSSKEFGVKVLLLLESEPDTPSALAMVCRHFSSRTSLWAVWEGFGPRANREFGGYEAFKIVGFVLALVPVAEDEECKRLCLLYMLYHYVAVHNVCWGLVYE